MPSCSLELTDKFVRTLGTIGGRSLLKCAESMVSSAIAVINKDGGNAPHRQSSDGEAIVISSSGKEIMRAKAEIQKLEMEGSHYKFQRGNVVFTAREQKTLERFKSALMEVAEFRKRYLLDNYTDEQLVRYGIEREFVAELPERANALQVMS